MHHKFKASLSDSKVLRNSVRPCISIKYKRGLGVLLSGQVPLSSFLGTLHQKNFIGYLFIYYLFLGYVGLGPGPSVY